MTAIEQAWAADAHAKKEHTYEAWMVAADAFEEAGRLDIAERLRREARPLKNNLSRKELLHVAMRTADDMFAGHKRPTQRLIERAYHKAFTDIGRADRLAGTAHHRSVRYSHHVSAIARRAVTLAARRRWGTAKISTATPERPWGPPTVRDRQRDLSREDVERVDNHAFALEERALHGTLDLTDYPARATDAAEAFEVAADAWESIGDHHRATIRRGMAKHFYREAFATSHRQIGMDFLVSDEEARDAVARVTRNAPLRFPQSQGEFVLVRTPWDALAELHRYQLDQRQREVLRHRRPWVYVLRGLYR